MITASETELRSQLRDVVAILALPAVWNGGDAAHIAEALVDVLSSMLRLDLAYIRATDSSGNNPLETGRVQGRPDLGNIAREIAALFARRPAESDETRALVCPHPATGELLRATQIALGLERHVGVLIAASRRSSFPTAVERFLIQSAVTQAAIAFRNAALMTALNDALHGQQAALADAEAANRAKDQLNAELERRVAERTRQVSLANEELRKEIAERKWAEEQMLRAEERWRAVFENSGVGIALGDASGRIQAANATYQTMLGYSEQELRALSFLDITHEDDREENWNVFAELIQGRKQRFVFEKHYRRKDGRAIWVTVNSSLLPGTAKVGRLFMSVVEDITERKRSERRLATQYTIARVLSEADTVASATPHLLQAIGQSMEWEWGALWKVDREAGVLRCESIWRTPDVEAAELDAVNRNVTFTRGRGLPGRAWQIGKPVWTADATTDARFLRVPHAVKVGLRGAIAFSILLSGETLGVIEFFSRTIRQPDEEELETLAAIGSQIGQFIDRKRADEALRRAQAELGHVSRVLTLGELTASIAHEVNQPLAGVVTNGQACLRWLAHETPHLDEARAAVERIIRDGNRAGEVIRRIRALSKKTDPQRAPLDVNDVIQDVVLLVRREVLSHRVSLRTELAAAPPPVLGDRIELQQVIINLMINGIEAMAPVTDRPRELVIRSRCEAEQVVVAVQDVGIGLDLESLDRLFNAFYTTKPGGMGMGLSISRSIIEAHGGRLWASRNIGPGAVFQFTLPPHREHAS